MLQSRVIESEETQAQVERILQSATFRNAEALRRLLRYLTDKSLAGEAGQLKEYTVAVEALGKPQSYDPRQDSQVRIQVGRLRQKLAEYYRSEGAHDQIVVEIPKGHFVLQAALGPRQKIDVDEPTSIAPESVLSTRWRRIILAMGAALVLCAALVFYMAVELWSGRQAGSIQWTSDMDDLWKPFITSHRPLLVSVAAPVFVGLPGTGLLRDLSANTWEEALNSPKIATLLQGLHNPQLVSRYDYTGFGQMGAIFQLGKLLARRDLNISFVKSSNLSWQQLSDNNVILLGAPQMFSEQTGSLPAELELAWEGTSIRILHPEHAQPALLSLNYPTSLLSDDSTSRPEDGEIFALITLRPGILGQGYVASFISNRGPGTLGAVRWFTEPTAVRTLVSKLRKSSGKLPAYYQVVLKVKYNDNVPTEVTYLMHRELNSVTVPSAVR